MKGFKSSKSNLMNNYQKNILVFLLKKCNQFRVRMVIKKFVDWCDDIYVHIYHYVHVYIYLSTLIFDNFRGGGRACAPTPPSKSASATILSLFVILVVFVLCLNILGDTQIKVKILKIHKQLLDIKGKFKKKFNNLRYY